MKLLLICLIGLFAAPSLAANCTQYREEGYRAIREARGATGISVGFAGSTPEAAREYRCILQETDAREIFAQLFQQAGPPGKVYALAGLYVVDRPKFDRFVKWFERTWKPIPYISGCIISSKSIEEFAAILKSGQYSAMLAYDLDAAREQALQRRKAR